MNDEPKHEIERVLEEFSSSGFLSEGMSLLVPLIRKQSEELFKLAEDTSAAFISLGNVATKKAHGISVWSRESVSTRTLMRALGLLQGVIVLTERGMVVESRTLARGVFECSFAIAALCKNPDSFIDLLKKDSEASRKRQASFIHDQKIGEGSYDPERLKEVIDGFEKGLRTLNFKEIAASTPISGLYLEYQRLSDDSAHLTARSLHKLFKLDGKRVVGYRAGPGEVEENTATLHKVVMAALPVGAGVASIFGDEPHYAAFDQLGERFKATSSGATI